MQHTIKVKVIRWDKNRGEGWVRCLESGIHAPVYACNLPGKKTWYAETACVYYNQGETVEVTQDENDFIIGVTKPEFDAEKWNSLDHKRLAFRCNDDGEAVNGLFSKE